MPCRKKLGEDGWCGNMGRGMPKRHRHHSTGAYQWMELPTFVATKATSARLMPRHSSLTGRAGGERPPNPWDKLKAYSSFVLPICAMLHSRSCNRICVPRPRVVTHRSAPGVSAVRVKVGKATQLHDPAQHHRKRQHACRLSPLRSRCPHPRGPLHRRALHASPGSSAGYVLAKRVRPHIEQHKVTWLIQRTPGIAQSPGVLC